MSKWIKGREEVNEVGRTKGERSQDLRYKEEYIKGVEGEVVKWNEASDVEQMWEQVKKVVNSASRCW